VRVASHGDPQVVAQDRLEALDRARAAPFVNDHINLPVA
jgi:hypothetical protein